QAFAAMDRAATMRQTEEARLRKRQLGEDAAPPRLVDNEPCIRVQTFLVRRRPDEQAFVDRVLPLDREEGHANEAELFIKCDSLLVVVQNREIEPGHALGLEMAGQMAHEHF